MIGHRRERHAVDSDQPSDEEVDSLIARSEALLAELRDTFAEIRALLQEEATT